MPRKAVKMKAKHPGRCHRCPEPVKVGEWILWDKPTGKLCHVECKQPKRRKEDIPPSHSPPSDPHETHGMTSQEGT